MKRRYGGAGILIAVLMVSVVQCDPGRFSLFPTFLTSVIRIVNVEDRFEHADGERFSFYVMRAERINTDYLYLLQVLPDGTRNLAVYDGLLDPLTAIESGDVGRAHTQLDYDAHLTGRTAFIFTDPTALTFQSDAGSMPEERLDPDAPAAALGATVYQFAMDNSGTDAALTWREFQYVSGADPFTPVGTVAESRPLGTPTHQKFDIEETAAMWVSGNQAIVLILSDQATRLPFVVVLSSSGDITRFEPVYNVDAIVPGSVRFAPGDSFVAQTADGYFRRFWVEWSSDDKMMAENLNGFLIAYATDEYMYLFNPATFDLFKSRSWWRDNHE